MKRIMVVDDDETHLFSIRLALESGGPEFNVITVKSGEGCIEFLKNDDNIDLIILDLMMPEMSGWEVFDKLRDNPDWRQIPIIFLTARADRIAENAGEFLGKDFINKPVENEELINRVKIALENKD